MIFNVLKKLYKLPQVVCGGSNSTHTFCTQALYSLYQLSPFSKARRNLPQGIRGLCNYQMDLESKSQEGHS